MERGGIYMFGRLKKLKRIPSDLVSYIIIEAEAIQDFNDKQMISSYCLHKLDVVNWYIDVLDAGDDRYIVPHSRAQLERIRDELQEAHKQITAVKVKKPGDRPLLDIHYPEGYGD